MKTWKAALAVGLLSGGCVAGMNAAQAQAASFPDVPANHWAYQAVQDLADKGYVKGYPDGKFLGKRALTRYEFATVIDRMAQTIADLSAQVKANQPARSHTHRHPRHPGRPEQDPGAGGHVPEAADGTSSR